MVITHIPNLETLFVEPEQSEPTYFGDRVIAKDFKAIFIFNDRKLNWQVWLNVEVSDLGTPKLKSVQVIGTEQRGVERWQLKLVEQYRFDLLRLAIRTCIETRWPTVMLRREYSAENVAIGRALTSAGQKPSELVIDHPDTITGTLPNGEVADFVRFWDGNPNPINEKEIKLLEIEIGKKIRKKIDRDFLAQVAEIYLANENGGQATKAVKDHFNVKHRTAQDYVAMARTEKLLPKYEKPKRKGK